ncbi:MAG TPA: aminotransferase class V-fold PLP-dependent enzyme, partial [Methanomassiliicoccaceae archaeon]|nr:aminotransferase class V-fold PLP-dependent enzyme [Methanomassiliicoccaceae archaeon]
MLLSGLSTSSAGSVLSSNPANAQNMSTRACPTSAVPPVMKGVRWDAAAFGLIENRSQNLVSGEFGGKFAKAAKTPWLQAPDVRNAEPGSRAEAEVVEGVDVYAWPHNETSTGVASPIRRVAAEGALTVIDATSAAGGIDFDVTETDVYYFAPQKNLG